MKCCTVGRICSKAKGNLKDFLLNPYTKEYNLQKSLKENRE